MPKQSSRQNLRDRKRRRDNLQLPTKIMLQNLRMDSIQAGTMYARTLKMYELMEKGNG